MKEHLKHFVSACNIGGSDALSELVGFGNPALQNCSIP